MNIGIYPLATRTQVTNSQKVHQHLRLSGIASILFGALLAVGACNEGATAGSICAEHNDCANDLQCLADVCVARCTENTQCGDGYHCTTSGTCEEVVSKLGDSCVSEWECGINQGCQLNLVASSSERLGGTCQVQGQGLNIGSECGLDDDCRSGLCAIGRCSQLCSSNADCSDRTDCTDLPRKTTEGPALFRGCLQNYGVLKHTIPVGSPSEQILVPVPASARSFALVTSADDDLHTIGATRVESPSGELLYSEGLEAEPIRYFRQQQVSTLLVPNRDTLELETGYYKIDIKSTLGQVGAGTVTPEVSVYYKLDDRRLLDLHFYFLDLEDHPCKENIGGKTLNALSAPGLNTFKNEYLGEIRAILGGGNLTIGNVRYTDLQRADLDGIVGDNLPSLLRLADNESGIAIFFVRSLSPDGVQAQIGGVPGPPRTPGTVGSGIAISADTLCYRSWQTLARVTSHSIAGQMGLWNNRDPQGIKDPISDSDSLSDNLMFFSEFGGRELSEGQKKILGLYPGLR